MVSWASAAALHPAGSGPTVVPARPGLGLLGARRLLGIDILLVLLGCPLMQC